MIGLPEYFALARALRLEWKGDDGTGRARTKFCAFVPGRYKASTGIFPVRTDFRSGTLSAYIGTQRSARSAVRGLLD